MYKRPVPRKTGCPGHITTPWPFKRDDDAHMWNHHFKPIRDWEGYINCLKMDGASEEEIVRAEKLHKRSWPVVTVEKNVKTYNTQPVIMKTKIDGDRIRVKLVENKLSTMLREYMSKGKIPPQKIWIEAWIYAGRSYSDILGGIVKQKSHKNDRCPLLEATSSSAPVNITKKVLVPVKKRV